MIVAGSEKRTARSFACRIQLEIKLLARVSIEYGWHRSPARDNQRILGRKQCTLRTNPGKRRCAVGLFDVLRASFVVEPNDVAGLLVESINEGPHERPNTRRKINLVSIDDRPASSWPSGDQSPVSDRAMLKRCGSKPPKQCTGRCVKRIKATIIA